MSDVGKLYVEKVITSYKLGCKLHGLEKEKKDRFSHLKDTAIQLQTNIIKAKQLHKNIQVVEFEKLIENCFTNLRFETTENYTTELEEANKQLLKCIKYEEQLINEESEKRRIEDLYQKRLGIAKYQKCIHTNHSHTVGLKTDGTVVVVGWDKYGLCWTHNWKDIIAVSAGYTHTVGLKVDGTVVAVGDNEYGQCNTKYWQNIVEVSANACHTVGLRADGSVVAVGFDENYECRTGGWQDIIAIFTGREETVGIKANGSVVAVGDAVRYRNVENWKDIIAISVSYSEVFGLKANGEVVNNSGYPNEELKDWQNIIAISAGNFHIVGLKANGTVVAVGANEEGQCDTQDWQDIIAICAGSYITVGLKADGRVVAVGDNRNGACNTSKWNNIVAISVYHDHVVGLNSNGKVYAVGDNERGQCNTNGWSNIGPVDKKKLLERKQKEEDELCKKEQNRKEGELRRIEQSNGWKSKGLCRSCGGKFSGFFTKKCTVCGKAKDY